VENALAQTCGSLFPSFPPVSRAWFLAQTHVPNSDRDRTRKLAMATDRNKKGVKLTSFDSLAFLHFSFLFEPLPDSRPLRPPKYRVPSPLVFRRATVSTGSLASYLLDFFSVFSGPHGPIQNLF